MVPIGSDSKRIPGLDRRTRGCSDVYGSMSIGMSFRMSWHIHPVHVWLTVVSPPLFTFLLYRIGEDGRRLGEITVVRTIGDRRLMTSVAIVMLLLVSGIMFGASDSEANADTDFIDVVEEAKKENITAETYLDVISTPGAKRFPKTLFSEYSV